MPTWREWKQAAKVPCLYKGKGAKPICPRLLTKFISCQIWLGASALCWLVLDHGSSYASLWWPQLAMWFFSLPVPSLLSGRLSYISVLSVPCCESELGASQPQLTALLLTGFMSGHGRPFPPAAGGSLRKLRGSRYSVKLISFLRKQQRSLKDR